MKQLLLSYLLVSTSVCIQASIPTSGNVESGKFRGAQRDVNLGGEMDSSLEQQFCSVVDTELLGSRFVNGVRQDGLTTLMGGLGSLSTPIPWFRGVWGTFDKCIDLNSRDGGRVRRIVAHERRIKYQSVQASLFNEFSGPEIDIPLFEFPVNYTLVKSSCAKYTSLRHRVQYCNSQATCAVHLRSITHSRDLIYEITLEDHINAGDRGLDFTVLPQSARNVRLIWNETTGTETITDFVRVSPTYLNTGVQSASIPCGSYMLHVARCTEADCTDTVLVKEHDGNNLATDWQATNEGFLPRPAPIGSNAPMQWSTIVDDYSRGGVAIRILDRMANGDTNGFNKDERFAVYEFQRNTEQRLLGTFGSPIGNGLGDAQIGQGGVFQQGPVGFTAINFKETQQSLFVFVWWDCTAEGVDCDQLISRVYVADHELFGNMNDVRFLDPSGLPGEMWVSFVDDPELVAFIPISVQYVSNILLRVPPTIEPTESRPYNFFEDSTRAEFLLASMGISALIAMFAISVAWHLRPILFPGPFPTSRKRKYSFFISYRQRDDTVDPMFHLIERKKGTVWYDKRTADSALSGILKAIKSSNVFVLCMTKTYFESPYCLLELAYAIRLDIPIVVCNMIEGGDYNTDFTPYLQVKDENGQMVSVWEHVLSFDDARDARYNLARAPVSRWQRLCCWCRGVSYEIIEGENQRIIDRYVGEDNLNTVLQIEGDISSQLASNVGATLSVNELDAKVRAILSCSPIIMINPLEAQQGDQVGRRHKQNFRNDTLRALTEFYRNKKDFTPSKYLACPSLKHPDSLHCVVREQFSHVNQQRRVPKDEADLAQGQVVPSDFEGVFVNDSTKASTTTAAVEDGLP